MDNIVRHIRQSLSWKLSLGILLMAIPIFVLSIGFLFIHSRDKVKKEATEHAASVVNTTMQHITRFMDIVETATDVNDWEVTAHLDPDSILAISRGIVMLNGHIDGCSISTEPNIFPKYGRNFSAYTVREADTITTVIEEPYEYFEKVWYKTPHLQGKPCWVVYYDESDSLALTLDGMIASYSKPLYNENKHFVGVISTDLSLIRLSKVITSGHYDEQIPRSPRYDVVSRLQNSFATMQESLNDHVNEIRQMNEEALRRNEELVHTSELAKASNQQKTLFIQNVSHQIRTPLNIIMGFAQVLKESKGLMPDEEAVSITDMMRHNAVLLNRMVLMLADCSARGTTEELYANKNEEVSCLEVAQESIRQAHENYPDIDFRLTVDLADDFSITANRHYLMLSVRELLINAANHSTGGYAWLRVTEYLSKIRFIVQDEGPGIPKEESDRMFEMFTKVNDLSEGLGLGLALTKRHIQNLGGIVFLDESYTEGCRMIIELPKVS